MNFQSDDVNESGLFDLDLRKKKFETRIARWKKDLEKQATFDLRAQEAKMQRALEDAVEFHLAGQKLHFHAVLPQALRN